MMQPRKPSAPAGLAGERRPPPKFGADAEIERIIEARVALRAQGEAVRWRLRLVVIEAVLMALLVIVLGLALQQPSELVVRGALIVGLGCFATGLLMIALSAAVGLVLARIRRWRMQ